MKLPTYNVVNEGEKLTPREKLMMEEIMWLRFTLSSALNQWLLSAIKQEEMHEQFQEYESLNPHFNHN